MGKSSRRPSQPAFASLGTTKYALWDEDLAEPGAIWIELKDRISYGDENDMAGKIVRSIKVPDNASEDEVRELKKEIEVMLDISIDGPFRILVWTVDWNLQDENGKTVEIEFDAIRALDLEWADEVNRVITEHEEATGQGKAGRRKAQLAQKRKP